MQTPKYADLQPACGKELWHLGRGLRVMHGIQGPWFGGGDRVCWACSSKKGAGR